MRWRRPRHTHVLIEVLLVVLEFLYKGVCQVEDSLQREDELGLRVWRHQAVVFFFFNTVVPDVMWSSTGGA